VTASQNAVHLLLARQPLVRSAEGIETPLGERDAALLALLAVEGPQSRVRLVELLWPGVDLETSRNRLRQRLFNLRRQCGHTLIEGQNTLALAPGVGHDLADAPTLLGSLELHESPALGEWLQAERQRRLARRREALAREVETLEAANDLEAAVPVAEALLQLDPLSEAAHRRLMRLHYLRGDRTAAVLAFDRCAEVLRDEIGASPSTPTLQLLDSMQRAVVPVGPRPSMHVPASVLRPPRLVGRRHEWRRLQDAWLAGTAAVVTGEAGMGKTRLLHDLVAAQGLVAHRVAQVTARPGDPQVPLALLSRLLRALLVSLPSGELPMGVRGELARLLPELGEPVQVHGEGQQARFVNALEDLLAQAVAKGLQGVVLDDLHFADEASLALVQRLVASGNARWVVAFRPAELAPQGRALIDVLTESRHADRIALQALDVDQVLELIDSLAVPNLDARAHAFGLHRRTGGNPMYLLETIKSLLTLGEDGLAAGSLQMLPVAPSVGQLIARRLAHLGSGAVRLARCAAVAGQDFSADLAANVLGVRTLDLADDWTELDAAQVLRDGAFAHDLIYEAALASVPAPIAQQLHHDIAQYLAQRGAAPARLASHWEQAQAWPAAAEAWLAAAQLVRRQVQPVEQARLLALAADCFERAGRADDRFEALLLRASALGEVSLGETMLRALDDAQASATTEDQHLRSLATRSELLTYRANGDAMAVAQQAFDRAQAAARMDLMVRCALPLANNLGQHLRADEAVALLAPMRPWAHAHLNKTQRGNFEAALGLALDQSNRLGGALEAWERSIQLARDAGDSLLLARFLANKGSTQAKLGLIREGVISTRQGLELMRADVDARGRPFMTQCTLAHRLRDLGHYAEAIDLLEAAHAEFETAGVRFWRHMCADRLSQLWLQLGQPGRAMPLLADDPDDLPLGLQTMRWVHRADLARHLGSDALTPMRRALALMAGRPEDIYHHVANLFATAIVPAPEAEVLGASLAAWAAAHQRMGFALAGQVQAAAAALAQGAADRALPYVQGATQLARDYTPDSFYLPQLWLVAARVHAALGQTEVARSLARTGQQWIVTTSERHVPAPFRAGFLQHNPVNRALLALPR
jgi:DNA-binding SARP family transcriptional activator